MTRKVITIGRKLGSGGRECGERLAKELGIAFFDKQLIELASERSGIPKPELEKQEERAANPLLFPFPRTYTNIAGYGNSTNDILFNYQAEIITEIVEKQDCVIVGRCADFILKDHPGKRSAFINAPFEKRVERLKARHQLSDEQAAQQIKKTDKQRRVYYSYYTDRKWGDAENYDIVLNSAAFPADLMIQFLKHLFLSIK